MRFCSAPTVRVLRLAMGLVVSMGIGASVARSQQDPGPEPAGEGAPRPAASTPGDVKTVYASPAAEPVPALEYRFWPHWSELEPGNAVPLYLRALIMLTSNPNQQELWQQYMDLTGAGVPEPTDGEAMEKARQWLDRFGFQAIFAELRRAAFREEADYGHRVEAVPGTQQFAFLLPELQELRSLARIMDIRIRVAIADRDYDEAIALLRDGFRMAGSLREHQLLIGQLIGAAMVTIMLEDARLLSEAPGAPNLYWALATLPRPLIPMRSSVAFEADLAQRMLPEGGTRPFGADGWREYLTGVLDEALLLGSDSAPEQPWLRQMMIVAGVMQVYPEAKSALVADGVPVSQVEAMPVAEVVVRYTRRQLRRVGDDLQKWALLPPEVQRLSEASRSNPVREALERDGAHFNPVRLFVQLMPAIEAAAVMERRLQRLTDAAMTIEAVRAYAAEHDGRLPERLDQLEPLPALPDPRTGEAFEWEVRSRDGKAEGVLRMHALLSRDWTREYHVRIGTANP